MNKEKMGLIAIISALTSWLGILAVPVFLMVTCSVIDYITGVFAARHREMEISSYRGMMGIIKKICLWLLVGIGAIIDWLLNHTAEYIGLDFTLPFVVATVVAVWLIVNEIISILENMLDIGVPMPPFLLPLVKNIRKKIDQKTQIESEEKTDADN